MKMNDKEFEFYKWMKNTGTVHILICEAEFSLNSIDWEKEDTSLELQEAVQKAHNKIKAANALMNL